MLSSPGVGPPGGTSAAPGRGPPHCSALSSLPGPVGIYLVSDLRYSVALVSLGGECDIHSLPVTVESLGVSQAIFANKPQGLSRNSGDPPMWLPGPTGTPRADGAKPTAAGSSHAGSLQLQESRCPSPNCLCSCRTDLGTAGAGGKCTSKSRSGCSHLRRAGSSRNICGVRSKSREGRDNRQNRRVSRCLEGRQPQAPAAD